MQLIQSILYDCVYHSAPIILCVLGGMFVYKANVLNIALEGMMLNGAFVSILTYYFTGNMLLTVLFAIGSTLIYGLSRALAVNLSVYAGNASGLFDCFPYILMIAVLAGASYMKHKEDVKMVKEAGGDAAFVGSAILKLQDDIPAMKEKIREFAAQC